MNILWRLALFNALLLYTETYNMTLNNTRTSFDDLMTTTPKPCKEINGTMSCGKGHGAKGRAITAKRNGNAIFTAVFWEVKPYIYRNDKGEIDGFYPQIFANAMKMCGRNRTLFQMYNATRMIDFETFGQTSRRSFMELYKAGQYPPGLVPGRDIYLPAIYQRDDYMIKVEEKKLFINFDIDKAENLAVIVHRDYISLPYKIFRGIISCGQIFFMTFLMTIFFGVLIWLSERVNNPAFPDSCFIGTGTGVWWSFVSMTTVGYGDVVPNSVFGRCIAVVWVCIGVMIACIVTATVAEVVNGVSDLSITGKKIAVLENSTEAERVFSDFRGIPYPCPTYEEVYAAVRRGDVYAGAVNAEIAAWNIDDIQNDDVKNPLRIVMLLPTRLNLNMVFSLHIPDEFKPIIRCMHEFKTEVYERAKIKYGRYCPTETLYIESVADLFKSVFVQGLLGAIFVLFVIGISLDVYLKRKLTKYPGSRRDSEVEEIVHTPLNGNGGSLTLQIQKKNGFV
ncbi:uncharacterized protein [Clytia hemisphaerica]|uniref:uncharacterized protein n=1 Tax=Clytia hemisphaerica TaxID=252671 RepID=UPI0034D47A19|eukprot:TCONS_00021661-protein